MRRRFIGRFGDAQEKRGKGVFFGFVFHVEENEQLIYRKNCHGSEAFPKSLPSAAHDLILPWYG